MYLVLIKRNINVVLVLVAACFSVLSMLGAVKESGEQPLSLDSIYFLLLFFF